SYSHAPRSPRDPRSFPTRRSSDLFHHRCHLLTEATAIEDAVVPHPCHFQVLFADRRDIAAQIQRARGLASAGNIIQLTFHGQQRSEEHTSELQSRENLVCRLLLEK